MIRKTYTVEERVAIAELLRMADVCSEATSAAVNAIGIMALERASNLINGDAAPLSLTNELIVHYAKNIDAARLRGEKTMIALPSTTANVH